MIYTYLTGRCASGVQADAGIRYHAIDTENSHSEFGKSICGAQPGRRSNGWNLEFDHGFATCPKCLAKLARLSK